MDLFELKTPKKPLPIVLSIPHSGTFVPDECKEGMVPDLAAQMPDTDWHVDRLYDFAAEMGVTVLKANYSRYVIDLNRDPAGHRLYDDNRSETRLVPTQSFAGLQLYTWAQPTVETIADRTKRFFEPYHRALETELQKLQGQFKHVLLFDAHSIKSSVPSIAPGRFPDLILGDVDGKSCDESVSAAAFEALQQGGHRVERNYIFKGGFITRSKYDQKAGRHALQLEMAQDVYMNEVTGDFDQSKADRIRPQLQRAFVALSEALAKL